jgi:hypothetical protein
VTYVMLLTMNVAGHQFASCSRGVDLNPGESTSFDISPKACPTGRSLIASIKKGSSAPRANPSLPL